MRVALSNPPAKHGVKRDEKWGSRTGRPSENGSAMRPTHYANLS
jgi:hypothetical protein